MKIKDTGGIYDLDREQLCWFPSCCGDKTEHDHDQDITLKKWALFWLTVSEGWEFIVVEQGHSSKSQAQTQSSYRKLRAHIFNCQPKANSQQILGQDYTCPQSGPNVFLPARLSQRLRNFLTTSWLPCIQLWEPTKGISHLNHHRCYIKGTKKHADITGQQLIFTTSVTLPLWGLF